MFNLTHILTYLRAFTFTTYDSSQEPSDAVPKVTSSNYMKLALVSVTAMVFSRIFDYQELRRQDRRQESRLAALENSMTDIRGTLLPNTGCPFLDEDDDLKLPPPAYDSDEDFLENDDFKLPPPAYDLDEVFLAQRASNAARIFV